MIRNRRAWVWGALLLAAACIAGCTPRQARSACPPAKLCLHYGNASEPLTLDPAKASGTWEQDIIGDLMMGLTQDGPAGEAIPGMASSWETSADGLVWTFHLRKALWSDGAPVTADDFVFGIRRTLDPKTASQYASLLYFIKNAEPVNDGKAPLQALGVTALDPRTLQIRLEHPAPYLIEVAKHQTMFPAPRHAVERWGDNWVAPGRYVSNGPYVLTDWKLGDHVLATKNPRFYDADKVCIDQVFYYPTNDAISAERRVRRGELDLNRDIQSNRIAYLRQPDQMPAYVHTYTYLGVAYLAFNMGPKGVPALRDRRVRMALDMAIDREFLTRKLLRGGQTPAYTFIPPGVVNYVSPKPPVWASWSIERRQAAARRLLLEAGYGPGHRLHLEIKHRNTPDPMLFMPAIQADWRQIGVAATLAQNETQIAYDAYRNRDFQVADAAWIADFNDAMTFLYLQRSSTGAQNYGDYSNPVFDALVNQADHEPDVRRRAADMAAAERIVLDDAAVAPLFFYVNKNLVNPDVTGFVDNLIDWHRARFLCFRDAARRRARLP